MIVMDMDTFIQQALSEGMRHRWPSCHEVLDALPIRISYIDADQVFRLVNAKWAADYGIPRQVAIGLKPKDVLGADYAAAQGRIARLLSGEVVHGPFPSYLGPTLIHAVPHTLPNGEVIGGFVTASPMPTIEIVPVFPGIRRRRTG